MGTAKLAARTVVKPSTNNQDAWGLRQIERLLERKLACQSPAVLV